MDIKERYIRGVLLVCASLSVIAVAAITYTIIAAGWPVFTEYGVFRFLFGAKWLPDADNIQLGILTMIAGTGAVTVCALVS